MNENFDQQLQAAKHWAAEAQAAGWLAAADIAALSALENRSPASLFEAGAHRPLVAAFFGGTGVGKSSLLNRLAGAPIARAGVERPTSREVSIYLHESLHLRQLPDGFPVERVRVARHTDEKRRQVLWIDMPDIDSTEASNRDLVADWLPHIDVLIYVVSPERYRDDKGWRLLREHVREHAWLFVINQWDRGQAAQIEDFAKLLRQGGFQQPLLFRTDCREDVARRKPDEFDALETAIQALADNHLIEQLERRALASRREELRAAVGRAVACLGRDGEVAGLRAQWPAIWEEALASLRKGLEWPMAEVARAFVRHEASPLRRSIKLEAPPQAETRPAAPPSILWDDWAQMQLQDALDRLLVEADSRRLPVAPLKPVLADIAANAGKLVLDEAQRALRASLARPGNFAQRFFLKFTGFCAVALPLAAMGWVSWQAFIAYYESAQTHSGFLGVDFATHSAILVAIAWLLPFFLHQQLKPSTERAALRGLRKGIDIGLARLAAQADDAMAGYAADLDARQRQAQHLLDAPDNLPAAPPLGALQRMIPNDERR
ncbi:MAG: GTPase [Candidatus Methylumidiphilus sp.]